MSFFNNKLSENKKREKERAITGFQRMIDDLKLRERAFKKRAQMDYYKAKFTYDNREELREKFLQKKRSTHPQKQLQDFLEDYENNN